MKKNAQEEKRMNDPGRQDPQKQQSTRIRRHDIVIESSGNVQVSRKTRYLLLRDQRGFNRYFSLMKKEKTAN